MLLNVMRRCIISKRSQSKKAIAVIFCNSGIQMLQKLQTTVVFSHNFCEGVEKQKENNDFTVSVMTHNWLQRFENEKIFEPVESIEYIISHVLGIKV